MERKGENSGEAGDEIHDVKDLLPGGASSLAGRGESWAFTLGARTHDPFPGCNVSNVTSQISNVTRFTSHIQNIIFQMSDSRKCHIFDMSLVIWLSTAPGRA